jgi:hypothetical protein
MRSGLVLLLTIGMIGLAAGPSTAQPRGGRRGDQPAAQFGWHVSLQEGKTEARKAGKPLMVVVRCVP